jgi:hypothetical protein
MRVFEDAVLAPLVQKEKLKVSTAEELLRSLMPMNERSSQHVLSKRAGSALICAACLPSAPTSPT